MEMAGWYVVLKLKYLKIKATYPRRLLPNVLIFNKWPTKKAILCKSCHFKIIKKNIENTSFIIFEKKVFNFYSIIF